MEINNPPVVAEVTAAFQRYETALMANDVDMLNELFRNSPHTLRYGVWENLYGWEAIARYRSGVPGGAPKRINGKTVITTYGHDFATVNREFQRMESGQWGRQSQTWVRTDQGWRIVSAHVSVKPADGAP